MEKSALFWAGEKGTFPRNTIIPVNSRGEVTTSVRIKNNPKNEKKCFDM
jgi:hypothetical protein